MNAVHTPTKLRISVERYQKMVATSVLTSSDRVELIEGEIVEMAPIGTARAKITGRLLKHFFLGVQESAIVRAANPVDLGLYSEPEPDILLLRPQATEYGQAHPDAQDVLLLIEVSDSSLAYDQGIKRDLYARNGVREYWVVDVVGERAIVYRRPVNGVYESVREFGRGGKIAPETFPTLEIAISDLFDRPA
jgi:Uma2 family endonuclease